MMFGCTKQRTYAFTCDECTSDMPNIPARTHTHIPVVACVCHRNHAAISRTHCHIRGILEQARPTYAIFSAKRLRDSATPCSFHVNEAHTQAQDHPQSYDSGPAYDQIPYSHEKETPHTHAHTNIKYTDAHTWTHSNVSVNSCIL